MWAVFRSCPIYLFICICICLFYFILFYFILFIIIIFFFLSLYNTMVGCRGQHNTFFSWTSVWAVKLIRIVSPICDYITTKVCWHLVSNMNFHLSYCIECGKVCFSWTDVILGNSTHSKKLKTDVLMLKCWTYFAEYCTNFGNCYPVQMFTLSSTWNFHLCLLLIVF